MKKVFLIGDSIRVGYDAFVRDMMQDNAQIYWVEDNARFCGYTLRYVAEWARENCTPEDMDVVHWNVGLWDALHYMGDDAQTPLEEYRATLKRVVRRIKKVFPNAKLIFALTTWVVEEYMNDQFFRRNAEIEAYNRAACEVMEEENVEIDDLYSVAKDMPKEWHSPDGTHYTQDGYRELAKAVTACLTKALA